MPTQLKSTLWLNKNLLPLISRTMRTPVDIGKRSDTYFLGPPGFPVVLEDVAGHSRIHIMLY
eukprot:2798547-Lingulodinium_polyedra.AAC.1